jgi:hypothetical protein
MIIFLVQNSQKRKKPFHYSIGVLGMTTEKLKLPKGIFNKLNLYLYNTIIFFFGQDFKTKKEM